MSTKKIAFPRMGDYHIPIYYLLSHILPITVMNVPPITQNTIELGAKYSPNFVCTPFKYTLGTYIECLDRGATILVQAGGGCRYGYYAELQEEILKDLGYDFTYINLVSKGKIDLNKIKMELKKIDSSFHLVRSLYYIYITSKMIKYMDKIDLYIRENIGFEINKGNFETLKKKMLHDFKKTRGIHHLKKMYLSYKRKFKKIKINKGKKCIKVGIVGELYTVMEPFANYNIEKQLAEYGIVIKRYTNAHYLIFEKKRKVKSYLQKNKKYIRYRMGADAADNIARVRYLCKKGYDGIIHIKSSFCTPEIGAMPVLEKICREYNVPILYFSFDTATSEVGVKTRLEAFYDMIEMRRENEKRVSRN